MERNYKISIAHTCPQCGAPVSLDEAQRVFQCEYCRVRLYIANKSYFQYYLPPVKSSTSTELLFVPYWRFKGMLFHFRTDKTTGRIIDSSTLALDTSYFPISLGVRTQTVPLRYLNSEIIKNRFLNHREFSELFKHMTMPSKRAEHLSLRGYVSEHDPQALYKVFIGERKSLVYLPLYVKDGMFYDSVADEPLFRMPEDMEWPEKKRPEDWEPGFIPTLCPACGWDMEAEPESLTLLCRNCTSVWQAAGERLKKLQYKVLYSEKTGNLLYLPFWHIEADLEGVSLKTYGDLVRFANLPRVVKKRWEEIPCGFWVPAFKVHPDHFLKIALTATVNQGIKEGKWIESAPVYPVTLPSAEAVECVKLMVMELAKPRRRMYDLTDKIHVHNPVVTLVFVPFYDRTIELLQPDLHISINKKILHYGKNL
ncbi:MAG: hypothetical protein GXO97_05135 [Nitrospirae bacterium]|nr:hypothetical protein [Nitrospirota bacterium]